MANTDIASRLDFLRSAERLKDTVRSAYTASGRQESVADYSWRLSLLVMTLAEHLPEVDLLRVLKICVLHDLGEAIDGDIPAPEQDTAASKSDKERADFLSLIDPLPGATKTEFLTLWDEYEKAASPEARVVKAMDKIETILQHIQGANPDDFDYSFNLEYGRAHTDSVPITAKIRELLDVETRSRAADS